MFNEEAALSIQQLLDSMFRQVLPPLTEPSSQMTDSSPAKYSVECGTDYMTVDLADHFLNELQIKNNTVLVQNHKTQEEFGCPEFAVNLSTGKISVPISSCLLQKSKNETFLTYSYDIFVPPKSVSGLITEYGNHWMATCHYENRKTVSVSKNGFGVLNFPEKVSIHGVDDIDGLDDVENIGQFDVQIDVFKTLDFEEKYENYPINANLGEFLQFEINFSTEEQAINHFLVAEECWTYPGYSELTKIFLLNDRCVAPGVGSIVKILDRPVSSVDRWRSQVFKFPGNDNKVFIQCRVLICYDEADCMRECNSRSRRSTSENKNGKSLEKIVTSGELRLKRNVEKEEYNSRKSTNISIPFSLNFILFVVIIGFIMLAVYGTREIDVDQENHQNSEIRLHGVENTAFN